jgi:hypothetical protein
VSFDVTSNDTFALKVTCLTKRGGQGDGFPFPVYQDSIVYVGVDNYTVIIPHKPSSPT